VLEASVIAIKQKRKEQEFHEQHLKQLEKALDGKVIVQLHN